SPRSIRRLRWRYEHYGYDGLLDRRRQTPSPKRAAVTEVERMLHLYRAHYQGFNVRHFLRKARREHGLPFCYPFVKQALQGAHLGIEHILGYSPQAGGRSERMNGTLQGRLVNELRVAGITTVAAANRYLRERFLPDFNAEFAHPPADPVPAFVALGRVDLEQILCHQDVRVVARDNTVVLDGVVLQLAKQPGRRSCAGL